MSGNRHACVGGSSMKRVAQRSLKKDMTNVSVLNSNA